MPQAFIDLPERLDSRLEALPQLIEHLTWSFLDGGAFAPATPMLSCADGLAWQRLRGCRSDDDAPAHAVPPEWLVAASRNQSTVGFRVFHDGSEVEVAAGVNEGAAAAAKSLRTILSAEVAPYARAVDPAWSACCLSGVPKVLPRGDLAPPAGRDVPWLDAALDALRGEAFALTVTASPYPSKDLTRRRRCLEAAARDVDHQHLRAAQLANADRGARRAAALLDAHLRRIDAGFVEGMWCVSVIAAARDPAAARCVLSLLAGALSDTAEGATIPLRVHACAASGTAAPNSNVLRSSELAGFFALPRRDRRGFRRGPVVRFDVDHAAPAAGFALGSVLDGEDDSGQPFRVGPRGLCRHALVAGHTGSGKSTTLRHLLRGALAAGVPFLVLDPVKPVDREYRDILATTDRVLTFRVGAPPLPGEALFQFNPLAFPAGFPLFTHIDRLKTTFTAAFGLSPPGPFLLERAILRTYERFGWDAGTGARHAGTGARDPIAFPRLSDLLVEVERVVDAARYSGEISRNLKAALATRIGNLCAGAKGLSLDTHEQIPDSVLYDTPVILELMGFGSHEEQALFMGLVMSRLFAYRQSCGLPHEEGLRHILVVEEAHRLLKATAQRSAEESNTAHQAVEAFGAMIAEVRAYGQAFVIAEQLPSGLSPAVVKQTGLKFIHRLTPREDRELVGDAMALSEPQKAALATLATGEAVAFMEGMDGAVRVQVHPAPDPPRGRSGGAMLDRLCQLAPSEKFRFTLAAERAPFAGVLAQPTVRHAADLVLSMAAWGDATGDAVRALDGAIAVSARGADEAAVFALQDALLRRAVSYGWAYSQWLGGASDLRADPRAYLARFKTFLPKRAGPHLWCAACPAPCRYRYEGEACAADDELQPEFAVARREPAATLGVALGATAARAARRRLGLQRLHARGVVYCTIGHASMRRGDTVFETDRLLTAYMTRSKP